MLESVEARGKHLLATFDSGRILHSHLRMTGAWHVYAEGEAWKRSARNAWLTLAANGLIAVQFGGPVLELLDRAGVALHPALRSLGPDLLDEDPGIATAVGRARARSHPARPIGEVLLDQSVAAGIGNVVRAEALYALRVDPWAPLGGLTDETLRGLFDQARTVLQGGVRAGGILPKVVYGARRCRRCGSAVRRRAQGDEGRTVHWCPTCQVICN
ncbi:MAG: endonuclease [Gaiellales bacterium]|nr:endonuclease [Gaiellales bacterium]